MRSGGCCRSSSIVTTQRQRRAKLGGRAATRCAAHSFRIGIRFRSRSDIATIAPPPRPSCRRDCPSLTSRISLVRANPGNAASQPTTQFRSESRLLKTGTTGLSDSRRASPAVGEFGRGRGAISSETARALIAHCHSNQTSGTDCQDTAHASTHSVQQAIHRRHRADVHRGRRRRRPPFRGRSLHHAM